MMSIEGKSSRQRDLETMGVLASASLVAGIIIENHACSYAALFLLLTGLFVPSAARFIAHFWLAAAEKTGWLNSRIILILVYYLVLTPMAYCYRLSGGDSLKLKNRDCKTMYLERKYTFTRKDFLRTW